jgi:carboxymethylenebutenolidase
MRTAFPLLILVALGCTSSAPSTPPINGEVVSYPSGADTVTALVHRPVGPGPFPALVLIHGDHGLTDWVKDEARRLAETGYVTLAVDLYRGEVVKDLLDAHIMDRGLPEEQALGDLKAAVNHLAARPDVRADALGVLGWDMGGGYALDLAVREPRVRAVVTCYGRLTTDPKVLAPLRASVLGVFAGKDEGITAQTRDRFEAAMKSAGKRVAGLHVYPDCGHGFLDPRSEAPAAARTDAWRKIEGYLRDELGK